MTNWTKVNGKTDLPENDPFWAIAEGYESPLILFYSRGVIGRCYGIPIFENGKWDTCEALHDEHYEVMYFQRLPNPETRLPDISDQISTTDADPEAVDIVSKKFWDLI